MPGIFERATTIIKSNVNDLLNNFEDPEKMINQTIIDATNEYAKAKDDSMDTLAKEKTAKKKLDDLNAEADKWHGIAAKALQAGNEDDAKSALANEQDARAKADAQQTSYEATKQAADTCRAKLAEMEDQINQMKDKADQIKATSAAAKATKAANSVKDIKFSDNTESTFNRMEEKANQELAKAQAEDEMSTSHVDDSKKDLEAKYATKSTDQALEDLKKELGMASDDAADTAAADTTAATDTGDGDDAS